MDQKEITYFICDKHAKNSSYNNVLTVNITIESLFSSDHNYLEGDEAIDKYNLFCDSYRADLKVPATLKQHKNLYIPYYFVYSINGLEYRILIIGINTIILEKYFREKKEIPELEFLFILCDYDRKYKIRGAPTHGKEAKEVVLQNNIKSITTKAILPNSDPTDPIENQPDFASLPLYEYQKKSIKWMLTREKEKKKICFNSGEIVLGNVICDLGLGSGTKKLVDINSRENIVFHGGALIDEVGLGKTYQMIAMSLCNRAQNKKHLWDTDKEVHSRATIIICPNQLVGQWQREVDLVIKKESKIVVIPFFTKVHYNKYTYKDILNADFVITSYTFLSNKCFLDPFVSKVSTTKSYISSANYSYCDVDKAITEMKTDLRTNIKDKLTEKDVDLLSIMWHRIIVDEIHELYCVDKYKSIQKIMRHFKSNYKWCLSGTPFDKSDDSMSGMFDFITNYSNENYGKDIWLNEEINKYMANSFFRRNTKKSVEDENKLPPLKENIVLLNFSKTEWMMYNALLANPNVNKFSTTLRQLCCHPKIAEELKATISNCKSLDEIEKVMVKYCESAMNLANKRMTLAQCRLKCLHRKLEIAEWKQYAKCLRKLEYRVKFDLESLINNTDEQEMNELLKGIADGSDEFATPILDDYDDELKDDKETAENMKKKLIIVSNDNKNKIIKLTKNEIGDKSQGRLNIEKLIADALPRLDTLTKDYEGKKSTHTYYTDVMSRLKKTSEIENDETESDDDNKETCGICLGNITGKDLGVTKCGHIFCYNCVKPFISSKHKCPMCQKGTTESEIYMISKQTPESNTQEFKDKQSLTNIVGTKLANLIFFLKKNDKHAIIFSQWDDLLKRVGDVLNEYGINNVFCKGNVWQRDKAVREFNTDDKIKVIMLSSESSASGTNLTKAEMVILLDPVNGTYEHRRNTEWQAIGRAYRTGQTKQVQVVRFIIKDTVEEEIYKMNKNADQIDNTFSGVLETKEDNIDLEKSEIEKLAVLAKTIKEKEKLGKTDKLDKLDKLDKPVKKRIVKKKIVEPSSSDSDSNSESDKSSSDSDFDDIPKKKNKKSIKKK
jgi:SNF2 family DNA or RNA helicase